ncbi:MAG: hypothetical protein ACOXZW_02490 [Bacilli bacterium]|jgi:hypothetical protein
MSKVNYKVCRDNIFVGEVARINSIYRYEGDRYFFRRKLGQLTTDGCFHYRSMLFVPNDQKLANDLLYESPNYPILNVTDDETCLNISSDSIVIKDACNLAQLLEYFDYNKELTFKDLVAIRKKFFTGRFGKDNCELFGWKEHQPEDATYYENGQEITDPRKLKRRIEEARALQRAGHRSFSGVSEHVLPREYWDVLDSMGNNALSDVLICFVEGKKMNAFTPHKQEGPIKKLSRF